jgi:hypothetical protein
MSILTGKRYGESGVIAKIETGLLYPWYWKWGWQEDLISEKIANLRILMRFRRCYE